MRSRHILCLAVKLQTEPLDQERLKHLQKLFLGSFRRLIRLGVDTVSLACHNPVGAAFDIPQGGEAERDTEHMAEARILDDAPAEGRRACPLIRARVFGIDPAAASAVTIISRLSRFHGGDLEMQNWRRRLGWERDIDETQQRHNREQLHTSIASI